MSARSLSFTTIHEFTAIQGNVASACRDRLSHTSEKGFDIALGHCQSLTSGRMFSAEEMRRLIFVLPHQANLGDVDAVLA